MSADDRTAFAAICNTYALRDGEALGRAQEWWDNVGCLVPDGASFVFGAGWAVVEQRLHGYRQVVADACAPWFEARQ